mmetsp:Transcript_18777/g.29302  ORF Transcript_18777/g.29302 Transcript_18777/m.29302 type:complete len:279 (+) Transcript_18777:789-1625(+)
MTVVYPDYPGSAGVATGMLATDRIVSPPELESQYTEKLLMLPFSFFLTDHADTQQPSLGVEGAVSGGEECKGWGCQPALGSLSAAGKLTPKAVALLKAVLEAAKETGAENMGIWVGQHGTNAVRQLEKILGPQTNVSVLRRVDRGTHIKRLSCVDLAIDTPTLNHIATAADILWASTPFLTLSGRNFASRVGASLVTAVGLPSMVSRNGVDLVSIATQLLARRTQLNTFRLKLIKNKASAPLFNSAEWMRQWERGLRLLVSSQHNFPDQRWHTVIADA